MAFKVSSVLKAIGEKRLALYSNSKEGYWYFAFDDKERNIFETQTVYVMRLSDMPLERWIEDGKDFCRTTLEKADSRDEFASTQTFIIKRKD
jgi:hypothetical protein